MQFSVHSYQHVSMSNRDHGSTGTHLYRQTAAVDEGSLRIHVGNIPFSWTDKHLREQFEIFGPIEDVEVVTNAKGSKGFGFLTFLRRHDADRAMRVKNGTIADGRKITVSLAIAKSNSASSTPITPPQTPAFGQTVSLANRSSSLSPDAPMWMPITPTSASWSISPEQKATNRSNNACSLSSSPPAVLFPPMPNIFTMSGHDTVRNQRYTSVHERISNEKSTSKSCPRCGRSI